MRISFVTTGMPGIGYHGGAVKCWAILKKMLAEGHQVRVLSLFDLSAANPYLRARQDQVEELKKNNVEVDFVDYDFQKTEQKASKFDFRTRLFPWTRLSHETEKVLRQQQPDVIFCYHFDALSAVYQTNVAPLMAGVDDLWHEPSNSRWKLRPASFKKYTSDWLKQIIFNWKSKQYMQEMLVHCQKKGAFAAHYAAWLQTRNGLGDTLYFPTPVYDPRAEFSFNNEEAKKASLPTVLVIGDLGTTSTSTGLDFIAIDVLPAMDLEFGKNGYQIRLVGGGRVPSHLQTAFQHPAIKILGRVVPADPEFVAAHILFVPTPITLGIRVRIISGFSFGLCVVSHTANAAGIPEMKHEVNALLGDSGPALAQELVRALKDESLRERLGQSGRDTYEKVFSDQVSAGNIVGHLESLSGERELAAVR